ncbi:AT-rich interactive domain-containing protein 5B isoform X2 [Latimeria chalumnae]|uniref:AT-rich interactive domain-containing protein 5B n=2 Tax=Latimeria chalumnae TaxID=7897 RepID=H3B590_LATCH|nr:PREDICTED: AT-rich interactive domain-containing protein 5B isoform X2 [Latimeria chalumnae]|eukprot:XP_005997773.1 PREDICTED: AT-rich interactive domain-containing protein 5B isoform X2 [Latimeria chalumnae]
MEPNSLKWVGSSCGLHGPYIFYKAFQFHLEGRPRILSLGDFFFVRCKPEDPICIAELQLLWEERTSKQLLSSSKLYFLPEDTPQGRTGDHGEDEVVAVSEKVIVRLEDLVKWVHSDFSKWKCGLQAVPLKPSVQKELGKNIQKEALQRYRHSTFNSGLNFKDVLKEKAEQGEDEEEHKVIVLSYPQYCRYRSILMRIQDRPSSLLMNQFVLALGGIAVINKNTQILYCRDTFDHPTLIENESICDEFAPNLKGRPRKKKPCSQRRDSQVLNGAKDSNNNSDGKAVAKVKCDPKPTAAKPKNNNNNCKKLLNEEKTKSSTGEECRADEQAFLVALYKYMKERKTPIERIPYLGFKQINLWTMFQAAQKLGGYEVITARRQWKHIYDELGGNPGSTSAATCTRRHYERLILPYERFIKGEEDKPLPPVKPRKQESNSQDGESKSKVSGAKRNKNEQNQKAKKEKDSAQKAKDISGMPAAKEKHQEIADQKSLVQQPSAAEVKKDPEGLHFIAPVMMRFQMLENNKSLDLDTNSDKTKDEVLQPGLSISVEDDTALSLSANVQTSTETIKEEHRTQATMDKLGGEVQEIPSDIKTNNENNIQDQIDTCEIKQDMKNLTESHALQNALKQHDKTNLTQSEDALKEKELPVPVKDDNTLGYSPMLYSRGNPGIMSPLAKKKLLSQVSGTALNSSFPYGAPPPLISKKRAGSSRDDQCAAGPQASTSEAVPVNRPSVIQHAQSFKTKNSEDRKQSNEIFKQEQTNKSDSSPCDFSKHHLNSLTDSYILKPDLQDSNEKTPEKKTLHFSQVPSFLADFYSSPHLHNLYRHAEYHLNNEQVLKYPSRDMVFREPENVSTLTQHKHQEKLSQNYRPILHHQEKRSAAETTSDDQPTDLSLPKSSAYKQSPKALVSRLSPSLVQQESNNMPYFQASGSHTSSKDCNPKACRVPPMTILTPKKLHEPLHRPSGKPQNTRLDDTALRKMEEMVRPVISNKGSPQNIGAARPLKRNYEDLDTGMPEKKIRAVSPMHLMKETSMNEKISDQEGESSKTLHSVHTGGLLENSKFPLPTPIFPGFYPGTFVSQVQDMCAGLGSRFPTGYSHPLQYLKNQGVLSPLMQPLAIHSFMMQRQFLASSANSQELYRHLAAVTAPVGSSYGDLLQHSIYPLATINPQAAFPTSQLSSVHPSTKL